MSSAPTRAAGAQWYELAHDRLVAPVRESNAGWRAAHLSALQVAAMNWDRHGRADSFLATGEVLRAGEAWSKAHPAEMVATDREYLEASLANERGVLLVARASRRARLAALVALVLAVLATLGGLLAYNKVQDGRRLKASEADARTAQSVAETQSHVALDSEARAKASEADAKASEAAAQESEAKARASEAGALESEAKARASEAAARESEARAKTSEAAARQSEDKALAAALLAEKKKTEAESATKRALLAEARARAAEAATKTEVCGELISTQSLLDTTNEELGQARQALTTASVAYNTLVQNTYNQLGVIIASSPATVDELKASLTSLQSNYVVALPSVPLPSTC